MSEESGLARAQTLADLRPERAWNLLWHDTYRLDEADPVGTILASHRCRSRPFLHLPADAEAVLGSDGRYHPRWHGQLVCQSTHSALVTGPPEDAEPAAQGPPETSGALPMDHRQDAASDGEPGPRSPELHEVARHLRCPRLAPWWMPSPSDSRVGLQRALLIEAFGVACMSCHAAMATAIDHSPATGLVRGLLCRDCNSVIETCRHVSGCRYSDYLDNPPAACLGLVYADHRRSRQGKRHRERLARLHEYLEEHPLAGADPTWGRVQPIGA